MPRKSNKPHKAFPPEVIGALAAAFDRNLITIMNWADQYDDRLTSDRARRVYAEHGFKYNPSEVLESEPLV